MNEPQEHEERAKAKIRQVLEEISELFEPHYKFTLLARSEKSPEEDVICSEDDLSLASASCYRFYQQDCPHTVINDTNPAFCSNCGLEMS